MGILNISTVSPGLSNITPQQVFLYCNDSYAAVTTAGYLNNANNEGYAISNGAYIFALYGTSPTNGIFTATNSNGVVTLTEYVGQGNVTLPTVANSIAMFTNTGGTIASGSGTITNAGSIQAGASGTAGSFISFPGTASKGTLALTAVANTGNTATVISNAAMGQASTISIPDPAAATADFVLAPSALVSGNVVSASGTAGLVVDSTVAANKILTSAITSPDVSIDLISFDVTVGFAAITAGAVTLYVSSGSKQYKLVNLWMNGVGGTNFATGDFNFNITDGTTVYSIIPSTDLLTLVNAKWGDTALPSPAATGWRTSTAAGASLVIQKGTGTTNYTAGSVVISGVLQRVA